MWLGTRLERVEIEERHISPEKPPRRASVLSMEGSWSQSSECRCLRLSPKLDGFVNSWFEPVTFDLLARSFRAFVEWNLELRWKESAVLPVNDGDNLERLGVHQDVALRQIAVAEDKLFLMRGSLLPARKMMEINDAGRRERSGWTTGQPRSKALKSSNDAMD